MGVSGGLMRNVFDQYTQPENRLTHALVYALWADRTLLRRIRLLALAVKEPGRALPPGVRFRSWSQVYAWLIRQSRHSQWAARAADYFIVAEDCVQEGTLTTFTGIPFGTEEPYHYPEAKRLLKLMMEALRGRTELSRTLGVNPSLPGRGAITGRDGAAVWDFLRLRQSARAKDFTFVSILRIPSMPHSTRRPASRFRLTLSVSSLFMCMLLTACAADKITGAQPALVAQVGSVRVLSPDFLGYNLDTSSGIQNWHEPRFLDAVRALCPGTLRYPGGTLANYWDWRTGSIDLKGQMYLGWLRRFVQLHPDLHFGLGELQSGLAATHAKAIFDLNLLTGTLGNSLAELRAVQAHGIPARDIELGNEFYLPRPDYLRRFPDAQDYARTASRWARALHAAFPQARIAVVGTYLSNPRWARAHQPRRANWNRELMTALHGADAVTMHIYLPIGMYLTQRRLAFDAADVPALLGFTLAQMRDAEEQMHAFGGLRVWVTEYNIMDWIKTPEKWGTLKRPGPVDGTWTQALIVAAQTLILAQDPQVRLADIHALVGPAGFGTLFASPYAFGRNEPRVKPLGHSATGAALAVIGRALRGATRLASLHFAGAPSLPGGYSSLLGIEAWRRNGRPAILLLNLSPKDQTVRFPEMPPGSRWRLVTADPAARIYDTKHDMRRLSGTVNGPLMLAPYSLLSIFE